MRVNLGYLTTYITFAKTKYEQLSTGGESGATGS